MKIKIDGCWHQVKSHCGILYVESNGDTKVSGKNKKELIKNAEDKFDTVEFIDLSESESAPE